MGISVEEFDYLRIQGCIAPPVLIGRVRVWDIYELEIEARFTFKPMKAGGVYILKHGEFVKIGVAKNVAVRIQQLQTALPERIVLLKIIEGMDSKFESALHKRFRAHNTVGEWFRYEGAVKEWIEGGFQ